ncbi:hypothetical protein GQ457_08G001550 [Hibiscus cannabinus]
MDCKFGMSWNLRRLFKLRIVVAPIFAPSLDLGRFTSRIIWSEIREKAPKVVWHKLIWFPLHVPKHALIAWMALHERLPTKDRLMRMGIVVDCLCPMCEDAAESHSHLFFECAVSSRIWTMVLRTCGLNRMVLQWSREVAWAVNSLKGKSLLSSILRIAWSACIYLIWIERNARMYSDSMSSVEDIFADVKTIIRIRLSNRNINKTDHINSQLCTIWGLLV